MKTYIIFKKLKNGNRIAVSNETTLSSAKLYNPDKFDYEHWDTEISGNAPSINLKPKDELANPDDSPETYYVDKRTNKEKKQCAYSMDTDRFLLEYLGSKEDDGTQEEIANKKNKLIERKNEIKEKYKDKEG